MVRWPPKWRRVQGPSPVNQTSHAGPREMTSEPRGCGDGKSVSGTTWRGFLLGQEIEKVEKEKHEPHLRTC